MKQVALVVALLTLGPLLSACGAVMAGGAFVAVNEALKDGQNLAAQNYAVADYLAQQADTFIKPTSLIRVEPLVDIETPEISTTLAQVIPEQIGVRLSQLGYRVDLSEVTTTADTRYLQAPVGEKPAFVLTGNYLRRGGDIDVKTRIIDLDNNRIVAAFDYVIEPDYQLRKMNNPKPKIMRVEE